MNAKWRFRISLFILSYATTTPIIFLLYRESHNMPLSVGIAVIYVVVIELGSIGVGKLADTYKNEQGKSK